MDSATLAKLRPADDTAAAIRTALDAVDAERSAVVHRMADLAAERGRLLLVGTTAAITKTEAAIRDAATDLEQLDAIEAALRRLLIEAEEQAASVAFSQRIAEAAAATQAFNDWFTSAYPGLASAIAAGIALEVQAVRLREALRDRRTGHMPEGLPALAAAHVGSDARSLTFLVRLPSATPGTPPPAWPR